MKLKKEQLILTTLETTISYNISPNQLYLLYCIRDSKPASLINIHQEIRSLTLNDWLIDKTNGKGYSYQLSDKSIKLLNEIAKESNSDKKIPTEMLNNLADNISSYINIFPKMRLPSGKPARSDKKNIEVNFKWFFANHSYSWDTVLKATAYYVDEYERNNYMYMRTSQYFIRKKEDGNTFASELANYCAIIESGDNLDKDNYFKQNVV